jgi:hypothetical protein
MNENTQNYAPVALFAYKRENHLQKVIESLKKNRECNETDLHVFIDGPKSPQEKQINTSIEKYCRNLKDFKSVNIYNSNFNLGLSRSITSGITKVLLKENKIIILEDDTLLSPNFLEYMNKGLDIYEKEEKVASIHGYIYPIKEKLPSTFFLKGADCWGWGTWKRAWNKYNNNANELLNLLKAHPDLEQFDFEGYGGYVKMLNESRIGKNDSWAIKWYASAFLEEMYTLYPGKTLVKNIGMDGSGTHGGLNKKVRNQKLDHNIIIEKIQIEDNKMARREFIKYFKTQNHFQMNKIFIKIRNLYERYVHD